MISLSQLLEERGFNPHAPAKIVRHETHEINMQALLLTGQFEEYQSFQSRLVFETDYIVPGSGTRGGTGAFRWSLSKSGPSG